MRLFVALELDDDARQLLADYQRCLAELDRAVRWVRPEQIHLTLKFLGDLPDPQVPHVAKALDNLASHAAFDFELKGIGCFGSARSPRVIWAGVAMPNPSLSRLHKACEDVLSPLGFPPQGRAYAPHLTLGRVKDFHAGRRITEAVEELRAQASGSLVQAAEHITLFQSILRPQGSQYVATHKVVLAKG